MLCQYDLIEVIWSSQRDDREALRRAASLVRTVGHVESSEGGRRSRLGVSGTIPPIRKMDSRAAAR